MGARPPHSQSKEVRISVLKSANKAVISSKFAYPRIFLKGVYFPDNVSEDTVTPFIAKMCFLIAHFIVRKPLECITIFTCCH